MDSRTKFKELKENIFRKFRSLPHCSIRFDIEEKYYRVRCEGDDFKSYIQFRKDNILVPEIVMEINDLKYQKIVNLYYEDIAKTYLRGAKLVEDINDYLSLFENLAAQRAMLETVYQYIEMSLTRKLYIIIYEDGDFSFIHLYHEGDVVWGDIIRHDINVKRESRKIELETYRNFELIEKKEISLKESRIAYMSFEKYCMKIIFYDEYLRLETAVKELIRLVYDEKYNVKEAIEVLVKIYGYSDIFG